MTTQASSSMLRPRQPERESYWCVSGDEVGVMGSLIWVMAVQPDPADGWMIRSWRGGESGGVEWGRWLAPVATRNAHATHRNRAGAERQRQLSRMDWISARTGAACPPDVEGAGRAVMFHLQSSGHRRAAMAGREPGHRRRVRSGIVQTSASRARRLSMSP